jgi:hypothetical protein
VTYTHTEVNKRVYRTYRSPQRCESSYYLTTAAEIEAEECLIEVYRERILWL